SIMGKMQIIGEFASLWPKRAKANEVPRIWLWNISPTKNQVNGPQVILKKITYKLAATSASTPLLLESSNLPSASTGAPAKAKPTKASVMVMPIEPNHRKGLRPILSTSIKVIKHAAMLTAPEITLVSRASLSEKPAACHSTAP